MYRLRSAPMAPSLSHAYRGVASLNGNTTGIVGDVGPEQDHIL